jgi:hypothetical protein
MSGGRPTALDEDMITKARSYLFCDGKKAAYAERGNLIPTIEDFALYLQVSRDTIYDWEKVPLHKVAASEDAEALNEQIHLRAEFSYIVEAIRQEQSNLLVNNGLSGKYNATIAKLILSGKHGYVERTEQDITSKGESINQQPNDELRKEFGEFLKNKNQGA